MDVPPTAVLASLMSLCGFIISPSVVQVDGTDWKEPVLIWECVCMSTGAENLHFAPTLKASYIPFRAKFQISSAVGRLGIPLLKRWENV